jgi:hypothetical protein
MASLSGRTPRFCDAARCRGSTITSWDLESAMSHNDTIQVGNIVNAVAVHRLDSRSSQSPDRTAFSFTYSTFDLGAYSKGA